MEYIDVREGVQTKVVKTAEMKLWGMVGLTALQGLLLAAGIWIGMGGGGHGVLSWAVAFSMFLIVFRHFFYDKVSDEFDETNKKATLIKWDNIEKNLVQKYGPGQLAYAYGPFEKAPVPYVKKKSKIRNFFGKLLDGGKTPVVWTTEEGSERKYLSLSMGSEPELLDRK